MEFELFISFSGSLSEDYRVLSLLGRPIFPHFYCPLVGVVIYNVMKLEDFSVIKLCLSKKYQFLLLSFYTENLYSKLEVLIFYFISVSLL